MSRSSRRIRAVLLAAALAAPVGLATYPQQAAAADEPVLTLTVNETKLGPVITDGKGYTLYMFARDRFKASNCEGACLDAWPPVLLPAKASLSDVKLEGGLRHIELGVAMRPDGSRILTYNGWPLYRWSRDSKPGDVNGQWVNNVWFVLSSTGLPLSTRA